MATKIDKAVVIYEMNAERLWMGYRDVINSIMTEYKLTLNQKQYDDYLKHLTYPPNVQDVKKPNKKEYNPPDENNFHPTLKPIKLMSWLVKLLTNEGDTVLDCFSGSGTTGCSCKQLGRNYIGIEMNEEYIELSKKRMNAID